MANHSRRLDRLEERYTPRQIIIWNDHSPGCVEREFARRIKEGSASPQDEIHAISWEEAA
jgi:hypothetical protein